MEYYWIILIAVAAVIVLMLILLSVTAGVALHIGTGTRFDRRPHVTYVEPENLNLVKTPVEIKDAKGLALRGGMYGDGADTIVLLHGMGPGCAAYATEIAAFVSEGYMVLAVDYRGCGESEGERPGSFQAGIECARLCVDYVRKKYPEGMVFLWGHSWGAYSALCVTKYVKVDGVVAVSAPETVARIYTSFSIRYLGKWAEMLTPFLYVMNFLRFGPGGNISASKSIRASGTPALILQGRDDDIVPYESSAYRFAGGDNVEKTSFEGKKHCPYDTVEAEKVTSEMNRVLMKTKKQTPDDIRKLEGLDYRKSVEEDGSVMKRIFDFYDALCRNGKHTI
ncbi:MAG: alpha/beta hydrolase [Clostridia bacterium]|nr:alpha/beta hydrolase [Clostridia bacterium]